MEPALAALRELACSHHVGEPAAARGWAGSPATRGVRWRPGKEGRSRGTEVNWAPQNRVRTEPTARILHAFVLRLGPFPGFCFRSRSRTVARSGFIII